MKALVLGSIFTILLSCQGQKFKIGECIQRADQNYVWRVVEVQEKAHVLTREDGTEIIKETIQLDSHWVRSVCP